MFKKSGKRNFRKKIRTSDSENEENTVDKNTIPFIDDDDGLTLSVEGLSNEISKDANTSDKKVKKKKEKSLPAVPSAQSLLSFENDDDADAEVFKIKKSSHSRRIAKQLKKDSKKEKESFLESKSAQEPQAKDKKFKEDERTANGSPGDKKEDMSYSSDSACSEKEEKDDTSFKDILESGAIPDAAMIHLARKRRQQAREMGDFIPLENRKCENAKSRLIREDEDDHSDEDEHISFTLNTKEEERRRMQDRFLEAEQGSNSEGSDQEREWEMQQIKKGVSIPQVQPAVTTSSDQDQYYSNYHMYVYNSSTLFNSNGTGYDGTNFVHSATTSQKLSSLSGDMKSLSISDVKMRLQERLDSLNGVHSAHLNEHDSLSQRLTDSQSAITEAEEKCSDLEEQFKFFQEMRGYVRDLVECLNEKVPKINALESSIHYLLKQRAEKLVRRRQDDIKDQAQDFMIGKSGTNIQTDAAKQRRVAEREARRSRRRRAREGEKTQFHHDGLSSDDEEHQSDLAKYYVEKERIDETANSMFEDVMDDFSQLNKIKSRIEQWKHSYSDSYQEAYIGLCLPKLFTPFVRLHLVDWNPLEEGGDRFENVAWYESLMFYSLQEDGDIMRDDQDVKLVPSIIDKVIIPKVTVFAENIWDPVSSSQSKAFASVLNKITAYPSVTMDNKNTQLLIKALVNRIRKTLDDDVFMPLYPKQILENKSSGAASFFQRQQWSCIKLLGNILGMEEVLSEEALQELALDGLLNRYLILALQVSDVSPESIEKCQAISSILCKSWFTELEEDSTIPQLETFCRYLMHAAKMLDKRASGSKDLERKEARDGIKQVTKILVNIHAMDHAVSLANQFSVRL